MHNAAHSVMPVKCFTDNWDSWQRMSKITAVIHFTVLSPWTIKDLTDTLRSEASISSWQPFLYKIKHCFYHEGPHDMYVTWTFFVFTIVNGIEGCFQRKHLTTNWYYRQNLFIFLVMQKSLLFSTTLSAFCRVNLIWGKRESPREA